MLKKLMQKPLEEPKEVSEGAEKTPLLERDLDIDDLVNAAKEIFLAEGISPDDEKLRILLEEVAIETDLVAVLNYLSAFWVDAQCEGSLVEALTAVYKMDEGEFSTHPTATEPTVEESAERVQREVILARYGGLVREEWRKGLLTTEFLAERTLAENLHLALRWKIVEEILDLHQGQLNSLPKIQRQKEKKRLEVEAIEEAEKRMLLHYRS